MTFFTPTYGRSLRTILIFVLWLGYCLIGSLQAQTETNGIPGPGQISQESTNAAAAANAATTTAPAINTPSSVHSPAPTPAPTVTTSEPSLSASEMPAPDNLTTAPLTIPGWLILAAMMSFASVGGFLLYDCGLTRAKNCGHTSTLLLVGVVFGMIGYWICGFAVQTGGVGDAHAALAEPLVPAERSGLDHELGFMASGHHWGLMGSSGFFLMTAEGTRNGTAALFLGQAALVAIAVAAALGAALERGRLLAMVIIAFLIGAMIYPLFANWVWGGGWLAELGREHGLGHGFVDLAGAGVVHETAGTLALVIAIVLGPRYGKFSRDRAPRMIPGHNVPFLVLGTIILLISWTATNAFAYASPVAVPASELSGSSAGLAAVNALLGAAGGLILSFFLAAWRRRRPEPALLCRGLLGGAVAVSAGSALIDPWAAFLTGALAGLIVQAAMNGLERLRIDDPTGASAVHGAAGLWGVLAAGLFANGAEGTGFNGVDGPVRGALFGDGRQLLAQLIGGVTGFVVVFVLGYAFVLLVQKILGNRVELVDEAGGLDWPQIGTLGYQGDMDPEEITREQ